MFLSASSASRIRDRCKGSYTSHKLRDCRRFFDVAKTLHLSHKNDVAANRTFFVAGAQNPDLARCIIDLETDVLRDGRCFLICYLEIIFRDRRRVSYASTCIFRGRRNTL